MFWRCLIYTSIINVLLCLSCRQWLHLWMVHVNGLLYLRGNLYYLAINSKNFALPCWSVTIFSWIYCLLAPLSSLLLFKQHWLSKLACLLYFFPSKQSSSDCGVTAFCGLHPKHIPDSFLSLSLDLEESSIQDTLQLPLLVQRWQLSMWFFILWNDGLS